MLSDIPAEVKKTLVLVLVAACGVHATQIGSNVTGYPDEAVILDNLTKKMDQRIRPNAGGDPVLVKLDFFINSFGSISEVNMEYSLDVYLRQHWRDSRLSFPGDAADTPVVFTPSMIQHMWLPSLFFSNSKKASFHTVTIPNKMMRVYPNGTVNFTLRMTLVLSCPMLLTFYPMDTQECFIKMESFVYNERELVLGWLDDDPMEINEDMELPQFELKETTLPPCKKSYKTGNFSCLKARFLLKREFGYYLLQTYIPSILIVILSWVSFWVNKDAVPARVTLGVTTVLTITTQAGSRVGSTPRVSYPKAIDVWMAMCMVFIFGALLEFAIVNVFSRRRAKALERSKETTPTEEKHRVHLPRGCGFLVKCSNAATVAEAIDRASRILFPAMFLLFNLVYWVAYTALSPL